MVDKGANPFIGRSKSIIYQQQVPPELADSETTP
jgi:hypothetical protein